MDKTRRIREAIWSVHHHGLRTDWRRTYRGPARPLGQALEVIAREGGEHRDHLLDIGRARAGAKPPPGIHRVGAKERKPGEKPPCELKTNPLEPKVDHDTGTLTLTTWSTVNRSIPDLAPVLDPRSWGHCSDFFDPERTYRVLVADRRPVRGRDGEFVRADGDEPRGTTWRGILRERFDGPGVAVDTLLWIDFVAAPDLVTLDYSLYLSDRCTLGPFTDIGGVRMNTGRLSARPDRGVTRVDVLKNLRLVDYTPGDVGQWVDFGDTLSLLIVLMGVVIDDKFVLKLCCDFPKEQARA